MEVGGVCGSKGDSGMSESRNVVQNSEDREDFPTQTCVPNEREKKCSQAAHRTRPNREFGKYSLT